MTTRGSGYWELDPSHRLVYHMADGTVNRFDASIIGFDGSSLSFAASTRDAAGNDHLRTVSFSGSWAADEDGELSFLVNRDRERGVLVFRNDWRIDGRKRIVYEYEDRRTGRRRRFLLEGRWELDSEKRIVYAAGAGERNRIEFGCRLESLSLRGKKGTVKFRVGAALRGRTVTFTGDWRFGRKLALGIETGGNGFLRIDLGRRFLKGNAGEAYARFVRDGLERRFEAGVTIRF